MVRRLVLTAVVAATLSFGASARAQEAAPLQEPKTEDTPPAAFHPAAGEKTTVGVYYAQTCIRALDVLSVHDDRAAVDLVRTLKAYGTRAPGYEFIAWDGRGDDGTLAPPGRYAAHVRAFQPTGDGRPMDGMAWVTVVAA